MFFLVAPDIIYQYQNGVEKQIKVLFLGVIRINGIAAINSKKSSAYYDYYPSIPNRDWIAVATNKHLYKIYRGEAIVTEQYAYNNPPIDDEPNWEITHSGFKSTDFRYKYPMGRCYDGDFNFVSEVQGKYYRFESYIVSKPDLALANPAHLYLFLRLVFGRIFIFKRTSCKFG